MKKLTFAQGKLLIKLVDRQTNSTGYELVKALWALSKPVSTRLCRTLRRQSKNNTTLMGDDALTERVILMVESGQL